MIPGAKKSAFTLHDLFLYAAIASKHARLMVLLLCVPLTAGLTVYVFARPVFYSHALVHLEYLDRPLDTQKLYDDGRLHFIIGQLVQAEMLQRTARALGVDAGGRDLEHKYLFKIRAYLTERSNIEVEVWPWSADWAHRWTETMVKEFLADRQERRIAAKNNLINVYSSELKEVIGKVDQQFSEKMDFADQEDFTRSLIMVNSIINLPHDLTRLQFRLDELGRVRVRLQDSSLDSVAKLSLIASAENPETHLDVGQTVETNREEPAAALGQDDPKKDAAKKPSVVVVPALVKSTHSWDTLAQEQQQLKTQIGEASLTYLPGHRKMLELSKQLALVNERLDAEVQVAQNRFGLQYQELLNKKQELEGKLPEYQEISRKHAKLISQLALFDAARLPYDTYLAGMKKSMDAVEFAGEKERINLKYAGMIEVRDDPISPNRMNLLLKGLAAGILLALVVPFLIEYMDHTMSNMDEVESAFQLRGLGIVPQTGTLEVLDPVEQDDPEKHGLVENFRVIRTNVLSMGALTKQPHVIMVTSAMPKEGKTVVASNLAASFALTGARTLLIDTDLRRGRLHRLFGYRKEPGLSNVLLGESDLEAAFRPAPQPNLTILSAGRHLENGTELLGSPQFANLVNGLRDRFDRIVVDTPPVLGLSETAIMQSLVDGVLFVIWTGHTPTRGIKAAIESLRANGANFYGFVLNRLDLNATQNYYQYYYYSHDYYYRQTLEST